LYNKENQFVGLIDVDSVTIAQFDEVDKKYLEQVAEILKINSDW
jgi:GAF domain-containing protein